MIDFKKLAEPFPAKDLEWRAQREGKGNKGPWVMVVCYVDNRAIQNRLDEVCGPENWRNEFREWRIGDKCGVLCGISIRTLEFSEVKQEWHPDWVTKWDGADPTDIEPIKGGLSDSMKRAAVQWGIGRYLYDLDAMFATVEGVQPYEKGAKQATEKADKIWWQAPKLPEWALPKPAVKEEKPTQKLQDAVQAILVEKGLPFDYAQFPTHKALLAEYKRLQSLPNPASREEKNAA